MSAFSHFGHEDCRAELIWNRGHAGTVTSPGGHELRVGPDNEWSAERLFSIALQSALMETFLALAEEFGLHVVGYLSSGTLEDGRETDDTHFVLQPCVVVLEEADQRLAENLLARAAAAQPCRLLGDRLVVAPHVVATNALATR